MRSVAVFDVPVNSSVKRTTRHSFVSHTNTHTHIQANVVYEATVFFQWFMGTHLSHHPVKVKVMSKIFIWSTEDKSHFKNLILLSQHTYIKYVTFYRIMGT